MKIAETLSLRDSKGRPKITTLLCGKSDIQLTTYADGKVIKSICKYGVLKMMPRKHFHADPADAMLIIETSFTGKLTEAILDNIHRQALDKIISENE